MQVPVSSAAGEPPLNVQAQSEPWAQRRSRRPERAESFLRCRHNVNAPLRARGESKGAWRADFRVRPRWHHRCNLRQSSGFTQNPSTTLHTRRITMIRNAMFGLSLIAFSAGSAFAGNVKHAAKTPVVAAAPRGRRRQDRREAGRRDQAGRACQERQEGEEGQGPQGREDRGQDRDEVGRPRREVTPLRITKTRDEAGRKARAWSRRVRARRRYGLI